MQARACAEAADLVVSTLADLHAHFGQPAASRVGFCALVGGATADIWVSGNAVDVSIASSSNGVVLEAAEATNTCCVGVH